MTENAECVHWNNHLNTRYYGRSYVQSWLLGANKNGTFWVRICKNCKKPVSRSWYDWDGILMREFYLGN